MRASTTMALMIVGLGALTACSIPEVSKFPSPDGQLVAKLVDDRGGGAMTSAYESVEICPQHSWQFQCKTVFEGENVGGRADASELFGPMNISWRNPRTLTVSYCDGSVDKTVPAVRVNDIDIAIEIVKETHGDWPPSVPPNRREGSAPCL